MKVNELMIGDWVLYNETHQQILEISGIDDEVYLEIDELVHQSEIQPIPLTTEILEKNGFVKESRENHGNNLQYCILTDGLWIDISGENFFEGKLEYVHQLQHALKLCGIEKEIEL